MSTQESIAETIAKLLNKAEGTDNQHEAEAFSEAAERLMIKHAIDAAAVRAKQTGASVKPEEIIEVEHRFRGIFASAHKHLALALGHALGFQMYQRKVTPGEQMFWVGYESEIKEAQVLLTSLMAQAKRLEARATRNETFWDKSERYRFRRSFLDAFAAAVGDRVKATRQSVIDEVSSTDDSLLPAIRNRNEVLARQFYILHPNLGKGRARKQKNSYAGMGAGAAAASQADIGQTRIGGRRAIGR